MRIRKLVIALLFSTFFATTQAQTLRADKTPLPEKPSEAKSERPVKPLGTFSKVRSDGEHASGYSVDLWKQGDKIFGLIHAHRGLIGDPPAGLLENVRFDPRTRKFSFTAKLSLGQYSENVGTRELFQFDGILTTTRLAGNLVIIDKLGGDLFNEKKKINLPRSKAESKWLTTYKTFAEWKADTDKILEFRGPRW